MRRRIKKNCKDVTRRYFLLIHYAPVQDTNAIHNKYGYVYTGPAEYLSGQILGRLRPVSTSAKLVARLSEWTTIFSPSCKVATVGKFKAYKGYCLGN